MATDIHSKGFTPETIVKLDILRMYLRRWLPTFIASEKQWYNEIFISDLFAGEGTDSKGNSGSPLIVLEELANYCQRLMVKELVPKVVFNEGVKKKARVLESKCSEFLEKCFDNDFCPNKESKECVPQIYMENKDFSKIFEKLYTQLKKHDDIPHFMFLDQYGVKQITKDVFLKMIELKLTDTMFFFASSFAKRFVEQDEFKQYLGSLSKEDFLAEEPDHCHRVICDYYRSMIPEHTEFYIAPFSIKKGPNIYGLVFGSHSLRGLEKFLDVCWAIDKETGEANYNIDGDPLKFGQLSLFDEQNVIKKQDKFKSELFDYIKEAKNNKELYAYTLENGFLPKHTNSLLKELQKENKIEVVDFETKAPVKRKGAFYINYKNLRNKIKVIVKAV